MKVDEVARKNGEGIKNANFQSPAQTVAVFGDKVTLH